MSHDLQIRKLTVLLHKSIISNRRNIIYSIVVDITITARKFDNTISTKIILNPTQPFLHIQNPSNDNKKNLSWRRPVVINLIMVPQVPFLPETQPAIRTTEWFLIGMYQSVPFEFVLDAEAAAAHVTGIRFFPRVSSDVYHQGRLGTETLVAVGATEGERVGVRTIVNEKGRLLFERLTAEVADVGTFVGVDATVLDDVATSGKHPAADVAWEVLYTCTQNEFLRRQALSDALLFWGMHE